MKAKRQIVQLNLRFGRTDGLSERDLISPTAYNSHGSNPKQKGLKILVKPNPSILFIE